MFVIKCHAPRNHYEKFSGIISGPVVKQLEQEVF